MSFQKKESLRSFGALVGDLAHQNQDDELSKVVPLNSWQKKIIFFRRSQILVRRVYGRNLRSSNG
ncbi:hypothetical protein, partial [Actinobacillus pleuropneumoniae]|uniref:hypothetical protein n=1 Tax=Actinobacillus pleuropneumoniae TaxID=715 RepID=UPI00227D076F